MRHRNESRLSITPAWIEPVAPAMDFEVSEALTELIGFLASFLATGAIGFRYVVLPGTTEGEVDVARRGEHRAALFGLVGAIVTAVMYVVLTLPRTAARTHTSLAGAMTGSGAAIVQTVCMA